MLSLPNYRQSSTCYLNPMLAAALTEITQVMGNLAIAIDTAAFQPELLDQT